MKEAVFERWLQPFVFSSKVKLNILIVNVNEKFCRSLQHYYRVQGDPVQ